MYSEKFSAVCSSRFDSFYVLWPALFLQNKKGQILAQNVTKKEGRIITVVKSPKKGIMFRPWGLIRTLPMREKDYCSLFFSLQITEMNSWRASCHPVSFGLCWNKLSLMSANLTVRHVVRGVSLRYSQIPKVWNIRKNRTTAELFCFARQGAVWQ